MEGELATGHTFAVFAGTEARYARQVAIKVITPPLAAQNPTRVARVLRAARLAATLDHPHIVPVYRVAAGDRLAWFVTQRQPGSLLDLLARDEPVPVLLALQIAGQAAAALALAHARRVLHGDLTPAVVMLDEHGAVKIRDFGIAPAADLKRPGSTPGYDPDYLAPERLAGGTAPSPRADQYALGVIVYQLLTGSLPFPPAASELLRVDRAALPVPNLLAVRPDVPAALAVAIERALAPHPEDRFPDMDAMARALSGRAARPEADAPAAVRPRPAAAPRATRPAAEHNLLRPEGRAPRRGHRLQPATAFAVLTTGLVGLWLYLANAGARETESPRIEVPPADTWSQQHRTFAATPADEQAAATPAARDDSAREIATPPRRRDAAPQPSRPPARTPQRTARRAAEPQPPTAAPVSSVGYVTVGSVPQGAIFINGRLMPSNPVVAYPVPIGSVRLRFEAPDANGATLERELTVNVGPSDTLNLGRVRLGSP